MALSGRFPLSYLRKSIRTDPHPPNHYVYFSPFSLVISSFLSNIHSPANAFPPDAPSPIMLHSPALVIGRRLSIRSFRPSHFSLRRRLHFRLPRSSASFADPLLLGYAPSRSQKSRTGSLSHASRRRLRGASAEGGPISFPSLHRLPRSGCRIRLPPIIDCWSCFHWHHFPDFARSRASVDRVMPHHLIRPVLMIRF